MLFLTLILQDTKIGFSALRGHLMENNLLVEASRENLYYGTQKLETNWALHLWYNHALLSFLVLGLLNNDFIIMVAFLFCVVRLDCPVYIFPSMHLYDPQFEIDDNYYYKLYSFLVG